MAYRQTFETFSPSQEVTYEEVEMKFNEKVSFMGRN